MKQNSMIATILACYAGMAGLVGLAYATSPAPQATDTVEYVEFVFGQNFSVETITCTNFDLLADVNNYGHLIATGCTQTGPLLNQNGTKGHVSIDVTLTDGTHYVFGGCRVGENAQPNFAQYQMICI
jgi:hypothetical protein